MNRCCVVRFRWRLILAVVLSAVILAAGLLWSGGGSLSWAAPGQNPHLQTVPPRPLTPEPESPPPQAPPEEPPGDDDSDDGDGSGAPPAPPPAEGEPPPNGGGAPAPEPFPGAVIINEIAWGGTASDAADQWIELFNITDQPINLSGWSLIALDGELAVTLTGVINAEDYFLLERTDDNTVSDIPADVIYTGAMDESGETLQLLDVAGNLIDTANLAGGPWPAGSLGPGYYSMERVDPVLPDIPTNWADNNGVIHNGLDAGGDPLNGTSRQPNSNTLDPPEVVPTPTEAPTSSAPSPTPTESPTPAPTATDVPSDTAAAKGEDQPPASLAVASAPVTEAEQQPSESTSAVYQASPPYWLFALGLGLFLVLGGIFLVRRS
jgi:hypothetical protein